MRRARIVMMALWVACAGAWASAQEPGTLIPGAPPRLLAEGARTEDWGAFLGPRHDASCEETKLRLPFEAGGPKLVWAMVKGRGYASPAIVGDILVTLHRVGDEEEVLGLRAETGERLWSRRTPTTYKDRYGYNDGPRASPVVRGERVYTFSAQGLLQALALKTGALLWSRDLHKDYEVPQGFFGNATTPLVWEDRLIINLGAPGGPGVVALSAETGETLWGAEETWGASYASPVPALLHGQPKVLVFAGGESRPPHGGLLVLDPRSGAIHARVPWRSKTVESVNAANPVVVGERVVVSASYGAGALCVELNEAFEAKEAWRAEGLATHFNTPIHRDGVLYAFDGRHMNTAELVGYELATGKELWREQPTWTETEPGVDGAPVERTYSPFRGTLLRLPDGALCLGELGHLLWLGLSREGVELRSRTRLFKASETWSLPILRRGLLYVSQHNRSRDGEPPRLLCYDLRGE